MRTPVQNWSFFARICYTKTMTKADIIFKENIRKIMEEGVFFRKCSPTLQGWKCS